MVCAFIQQHFVTPAIARYSYKHIRLCEEKEEKRRISATEFYEFQRICAQPIIAQNKLHMSLSIRYRVVILKKNQDVHVNFS